MKPAIILSGGAEIISVSVAQELMEHKVNIAIFSLVKNSVLRGINYLAFEECDWPPKDQQKLTEQLIIFAKNIGATQDNKLPIIATEDGGLRFLYENSSALNQYLCFGGAKALRYGGLEKAELFDSIRDIDISVPTISVSQLEEVENAINKFNKKCFIKPALKPFSMNLGGMKSKAIEVSPNSKILKELKEVWGLSKKWVIQERLNTPESGEYNIYFNIDKFGNIVTLSSNELWKQPKKGGTGCWVESNLNIDEDIIKKLSIILDKINFIGIGEASFLFDNFGKLRLIEINSRPWLQIEIAKHSGIPMIHIYYLILIDKYVFKSYEKKKTSWVNFERIMIAAFSGEQGSRILSLYKALKATLTADVIAIWSSSLPKVRYYWILKLLSKIKK